jgi:predicted DNA-binding protein
MNTLERLLQDELHRLLDRIAARAGADTAAGLPLELRARIDRAEDRLSTLRTALLEGYVEWARAIEECEDLWALAELRRETEETTERRRAA